MDVSLGSMVFVFVAALLTALATGLGALPFAFFELKGTRWLGRANAIAAGVMLGASISLLVEGGGGSVTRTATGAVLGVAFVYVVGVLLKRVGELDVSHLSGAAARQALLIIAVMTVHSAAEGLGIGASFGDTGIFGLVIAIAIAIHNIPEGLAISLVLVPKGASVRSAAGWSIFSSLPQPLLAVPSYLFVEQFQALLPAALGFAAGAMLWMLARELLPEAIEQAPRREVAVIVAIAFAAMFIFQFLLIG
jgi:zinc transporter ZupT